MKKDDNQALEKVADFLQYVEKGLPTRNLKSEGWKGYFIESPTYKGATAKAVLSSDVLLGFEKRTGLKVKPYGNSDCLLSFAPQAE